MKTKITFLATLFILLAVMLAACASASTSADLRGSTWKLVSYAFEGKLIPAAADANAVLTFDRGGKLSGSVGCNSISGDYTLSGDQITFGALSSTMMACADAVMQQEGAVFSVMTGALKYKLDAGVLTLYSASGDPAITFSQVVPQP